MPWTNASRFVLCRRLVMCSLRKRAEYVGDAIEAMVLTPTHRQPTHPGEMFLEGLGGVKERDSDFMSNNDLNTQFEAQAKRIVEAFARASAAFFRAASEPYKKWEAQVIVDSRKLGQMGWTLPMWGEVSLARRLVDGSRTAEEIDQMFVEAYAENDGQQYREMVSGILAVDSLQKWAPLIEECDFAFQNKKYLIVVPSLITILDGFLAALDGKLDGPTRPIRIVSQRLRPEVTGFVESSVHGFISQVFVDHKFSNDRRPLINRHWVLHGRDDPKWTESDCLRLFQALETMAHLKM